MQQAQPQEGTPVIPGITQLYRVLHGAAVIAPACSPQPLRPGVALGSAAFNQLHNSLNGGSAGHDGIDDALPPPGPVLNPLVDPPVVPVDPEPLLAP